MAAKNAEVESKPIANGVVAAHHKLKLSPLKIRIGGDRRRDLTAHVKTPCNRSDEGRVERCHMAARLFDADNTSGCVSGKYVTGVEPCNPCRRHGLLHDGVNPRVDEARTEAGVWVAGRRFDISCK